MHAHGASSQVKVEEQLKCFNTYFNSFYPSIVKTTMIQSNLGWSAEILLHITSYFWPLIPLLNTLREKIIVPMSFSNGQFSTGTDPVTHIFMLTVLLKALCDLEEDKWYKISPPPDITKDSAFPTSPSCSSADSDELASLSLAAYKCFTLPLRIP